MTTTSRRPSDMRRLISYFTVAAVLALAGLCIGGFYALNVYAWGFDPQTGHDGTRILTAFVDIAVVGILGFFTACNWGAVSGFVNKSFSIVFSDLSNIGSSGSKGKNKEKEPREPDAF